MLLPNYKHIFKNIILYTFSQYFVDKKVKYLYSSPELDKSFVIADDCTFSKAIEHYIPFFFVVPLFLAFF